VGAACGVRSRLLQREREDKEEAEAEALVVERQDERRDGQYDREVAGQGELADADFLETSKAAQE
jgi:hypothetical protein